MIGDVGAHEMWMSRNCRAERPDTCIISSGYAVFTPVEALET